MLINLGKKQKIWNMPQIEDVTWSKMVKNVPDNSTHICLLLLQVKEKIMNLLMTYIKIVF